MDVIIRFFDCLIPQNGIYAQIFSSILLILRIFEEFNALKIRKSRFSHPPHYMANALDSAL